jgi:endonuclease III
LTQKEGKKAPKRDLSLEPKLLQLRYLEDPWRLLVSCILLNRTQRKQVDRVVDELFRRYPDAAALARAQHESLTALLRPLGLAEQRSVRLVQFSRDWLRLGAHELTEREFVARLGAASGVGAYALDSYRMFVLGEWASVRPRDKELRRWREWRLRVDAA